MKNWQKYIFIGLIIVLAISLGGEVMAQCPMCKAAVVSGTEANVTSPLAKALNSGIIYLFILPYLTILGVVFFSYRYYKRQRSEEQSQQA